MLRTGLVRCARPAACYAASSRVASVIAPRCLSGLAVRLPPIWQARVTPVALPLVNQAPWRRFYAKSYPKHLRLPMPALSPTMTSGTLGAWSKKVGDKVSPGDVYVQIETDKATMEFESQEDGYIAKILKPAGSPNVPVNTPIAIIVEDKASVAAFADYTFEGAETVASKPAAAPAQPPAPAAGTPPQPAPAAPATTNPEQQKSGRIIASPLAKKIAAEQQVPLANVTGSGPGGRILKDDVLRYDAPKAAPAAVPTATSAVGSTSRPAAPASADSVEIPTTRVRKIIAARLMESKQTIPHYYLTADVLMDKLLDMRTTLNEKARSQDVKISVNDFVIKASSLALLRVPAVNSSWGGDIIRQYSHADIAVAVATPAGLITPIVHKADQRGLVSISKSVRDLALRAKDNKLAPHEYQGGSFSISNLGMFGVKQFAAIINPPHAAILAVGAVEKRVVPDTDGKTPVVRNAMTVTLSCDHRVVDGAVGAQWLQTFKELIEEPTTMLL